MAFILKVIANIIIKFFKKNFGRILIGLAIALVSAIIFNPLGPLATNFLAHLLGDVPKEKITVAKWYFANSEEDIHQFQNMLDLNGCVGRVRLGDNRCAIIETPCSEEFKPYSGIVPPHFSEDYCSNCVIYSIDVRNNGKQPATEFNANFCFTNIINKIVGEGLSGERSTCASSVVTYLPPQHLSSVGSILFFKNQNTSLKSVETWDAQNHNLTKNILSTKALIINNCPSHPFYWESEFFHENDVVESVEVEVIGQKLA